MLYRMQPTPVVYINLAVAVSYARSTDVALLGFKFEARQLI